MVQEVTGLNNPATFGTPVEYSTDAIVVNLLTGAVSEYENFAFHSIIPGYAGAADGLYELGANTDNGTDIIATAITGSTLFGGSLKKRVEEVFFSLFGSGDSEMLVVGENGSYVYTFEVRDTGESRSQPGKGIRSNYLAFGYRNADGADFQLDRIEVSVVPSDNRRI